MTQWGAAEAGSTSLMVPAEPARHWGCLASREGAGKCFVMMSRKGLINGLL